MLDKKKALFLKTKKKLFLNIQGEHNSIHNGNGLDFKEVREYNTGDDIRHVNWKVTARNLIPSVNTFNEDKQLNIVLVYLNSGSMYFGTHRSKQDTAIEVLTTLGFSAINKNDTITTVFWNDDLYKFHKPTKHKNIVEINFDTAYDNEPLGNSMNYDKLNIYLLNKIKKKSIIFLIGDFLDIPNFVQLGHKHEVYSVIIRDTLEENLSLVGEYDMCDTNTNETRHILLSKKHIEKYNNLMKQHDAKLLKHFKSAGIKSKKIYTTDDVFKNLQQLVKN